MRRALPVLGCVSGCLLFGLLLGLGAPAAEAQGLIIKLDGVPDHLSFPVPPGRNPVLTARIRGGLARHVWLAESRDSRLRLQLERVDVNTYQVNLGDLDVWIALGRKISGEFRVFASGDRGNAAQSIVVRYGPKRQLKTTLRPVLVTEKGKRNLSPVYRWRPNWAVPGKARRFEVRLEGDRVAATAEARAGDVVFPFATDARTGHLALDVTPAVRDAWRKAGVLAIFHQLPTKDPVKVEVRAAPDRMILPGGGRIRTLKQRESAHLAGVRNYVKIHIGDITAGQTDLDVWLGNRRVVADRIVYAGDRVRFELGDHRYTLFVARLVNFLIGDDYAILVIYEKTMPEAVKIDALVRMMRHIQAHVFRGEVKVGRKDLEQALAAFHAKWKPETKTLAGFIDAVAASPIGKGVKLRTLDRTEHTLHAWLTRHARVFAAKVKKRDAVKPSAPKPPPPKPAEPKQGGA